VIHRAHHLQEERLFDSYMAERGGEPIDPPVADHLADCEACSDRYAELTSFMETLRRDGSAEADAIFTPERLRQQQQQIVNRLAHVGRPARVLSFPSRMVRRTIDVSTSHTAPRWVAAAAAAGLFIGVAVGAGFEWRTQIGRQTSFATDLTRARAQRVTPGAAHISSPTESASDDAFLSDLYVALERPHTRELQAFDALTPHVREISDKR
jgi:hypothetical protein